MDTRNIRDIEAFDLRERILKDICRTAETVEQRNLGRIRRKYPNEAQAEAAYYDCRMSAAVNMVDKWGARFIPEICKVFEVDETEVNDFISDAEVAAVVDLEGRETAEAAADLEEQKDTAELKEKPNYNPEELQAFVSYADFAAEELERVLEDLDVLQDRAADGYDISDGLGKLKERIKAISNGDTAKIKELEAADIAHARAILDLANRLVKGTGAADPEETGTGAADAGSNAEILRRLDELEDSIHAIGTQVEAIWLHTGAVMLDDEGQAEK